jgi:hypothetical protein
MDICRYKVKFKQLDPAPTEGKYNGPKTAKVSFTAKYKQKEKPDIYRKYAETWVNIRNLLNLSIRGSISTPEVEMTYGDGVYLALHDKDDGILQNRLGHVPVSCPPSDEQREQIAKAYAIPQEGADPNPKMAASYLDIKVTRDNILDIKTYSNRRNVTEVVVKSPLIFDAYQRRYYLYFGPFMIGVGLDQECVF